MKKLLLFICCVAMASCEYKCPGYDISDQSLISFRENDTITYISNVNDTIKLLVFNTYFEEAQSWKGLAMDVDCHPEALYEALDNDTKIYIKEQHSLQMSVIFCNDNPYKFHLRTFEKENDMECMCSFDKAIEGSIYSLVLEVKDLSGRRRINEFIKVDSRGIIKFYDKETGLTWKQQMK